MTAKPLIANAAQAADCQSTSLLASYDIRMQLIRALEDRIASWTIHQEEAADRLQISRPYLNMIINRKRSVSTDKLIELLHFAGLSVSFRISELPAEHGLRTAGGFEDNGQTRRT